MAKDVNGKHISSNSSGNTSPSISDQQKVPPLRIVLNTAGNQKSSREPAANAATANQQQQQQQQPQLQQQQDIKRDKSQDNTAKTDNVLKSGGRVRIKLGSGKQTNKSNNSLNESSNTKSTFNEDVQKSKSTTVDRQDSNSNVKEDPTTNYSHLRRITRRSQRTVQTVSNEDEESISSMTSIDDNQSTNNTNSDNNNSQEAVSVTTTQSIETTSSTTTTTTANSSNSNSTGNNGNSNSSSNVDTPRRYKRKRGETSECSLGEHDGLFGFQNYKLPMQNSFELYKNIRKQVDKKLRSLSTIHTKAPHGFRDYMLTRGAYLLDGNKLGNGTNLFMNEDGGSHPAPIGKYHALRHNRINYSVPNRAKVPLGLPVNSPLYNLFIEQEKERYRMRMQHIKEREKLTLAAEQEIMRVYNQAAMAAANQLEPFSACTMLKHQEIYNYLDSDGYAIQANEDMEQDGVKQEGVRTRRRQHEHISPPPTRKNSSNEVKDETTSEANQKEPAKSPEPPVSTEDTQKNSNQSKVEEIAKEKKTDDSNTQQNSGKENDTFDIVGENENSEINEKKGQENSDKDKMDETEKVTETATAPVKKETSKSGPAEPCGEKSGEEASEPEPINEELKETNGDRDDLETNKSKRIKTEPSEEPETNDSKEANDSKKMDPSDGCSSEEKETEKLTEGGAENPDKEVNKHSSTLNDSADTEIIENDSKVESKDQSIPMEQDSVAQQVLEGQIIDSSNVLSDDDRRAYNKEVFLSQLQDIDDKWDKVRSEMLNRHRHEAESLHAVQKLEWEWKTKEIGACDVRTTLIIDNTLVPKLNIYSQDY